MYPHSQFRKLFSVQFSISRSAIYEIIAGWKVTLTTIILMNDFDWQKYQEKFSQKFQKFLFMRWKEVFHRENFINCFIDFRKEINLFHLPVAKFSFQETFQTNCFSSQTTFLSILSFITEVSRAFIQKARISKSLDIIINLSKTPHLINPHFTAFLGKRKVWTSFND